jgi:23S rRNA (pseudouridine1915-N3)-methyltransferase
MLFLCVMCNSMKIALLQTGKTTDRNLSLSIDDYSSRIKKYTIFELITVPDLRNTKNMPSAEQKIKEGNKILELISQDDYVILLDERGKEMRTSAFAALIQKILMMSKKRLVFVIGGPWGFSGEVYSRADMQMSLSQLTFPHQMVRLLFLEQLYRAFTIIRGEPYHHE